MVQLNGATRRARSRTGFVLLLLVGMLLVGVSPMATMEVARAADPDGAGTLTLLHNNDGESSLLPLEYGVEQGKDTVPLEVGGVAAFKSVMEREIDDARYRNNAVLAVYAGDAFLASATLQCTLDDPDGKVYDAIAQRQMPYDAHILGNHEFDFSPDFLERFIRAFEVEGKLTQPFLSANLVFDKEQGFKDLVEKDRLINKDVEDGRVMAQSAIVVDDETGQRFGIVAMTTPYLETISSPRNVKVRTNIKAIAQRQINKLRGRGVEKIIFVSHLQDIDNDVELITGLKHIDIAVAGGGDEMLVNPKLPRKWQVLPGEEAPIDKKKYPYPMTVTDAAGRTVYVVTTAGNYKYLGRIDVDFDDKGEVKKLYTRVSYPRPVVPESETASKLKVTYAIAPDNDIVTSVAKPIKQCLETLDKPIARSKVLLDVSRASVRGGESNAGNLIADSFVYAYKDVRNANDLPEYKPTVVAVQNGGGIRQNAGDVLPVGGKAPGTISRMDTMNVLPFFNYVVVVQDVSPKDVKQMFERSAADLPGTGGQFLQVSGLKVTYDLSQTAQEIDEEGKITTPGSRVVSVVLDNGKAIVQDGAVVEGAPSLDIVTNSFTAGGGDNYSMLADNEKGKLFDKDGVALTYEQVWYNYLMSFDKKDGLPTITADDAPEGGEGRITMQNVPEETPEE
jgi:2',3'-cyclic-nucleotide 2'-phosphodiesterase (5'-nucleotidase family)